MTRARWSWRAGPLNAVFGDWLRSGWNWIGFGIVLFLLLFLLIPVIKMGVGTLTSPLYWVSFFSRAYYRNALYSSVWLSLGATAGSLLMGVPLALLYARTDLPWRRLIRTLAVLSLLSPPFIGAYAWVMMLGRAGVITTLLGLKGFSIYGSGGVLVVFVLHHFAYVFLLTAAALERIDPAVEEAAESLGASPNRRLRSVTLPLALPGAAAGALLVFITTLADFGTPMLIGEGLRTLPVLAYNEFLSELGGDVGMASVTSLVMLLVAFAALAVHGWVLGPRSYAMQALRQPVRTELPPVWRWVGAASALLLVVVAALPQFVVVVASFLQMRGPRFIGTFGLDNYRLVAQRMTGAVTNTLLYATSATMAMVIMGVLVGFILVRRTGGLSRLLDGLLTLAQVLPGTVLGIGLIVMWSRGPLVLTGTGFLLVIAYVVRRLAFTVRAATAGLRQLSPSVEEASLTLGARPARTFTAITLPLILPTTLSGALVSWVSTLSELSSTIMLYTGRTTTISILIYNQVLNDTFGPAAALGTVLILLTLLALWLLGRWSDRPEGGGWHLG